MARGIAFAYSNVSTDTTVMTTAGVFYGMCLVSKTTGNVLAVIYDAKTTATGTVVFVGTLGGGTNAVKEYLVEGGINCPIGIHLDVTCTSGADQVIVYYGGRAR